MEILLFSSPTVQPDFDLIARVPNLGIASIAGCINDICSVHVADVHGLKKKDHLAYLERSIKKYQPDLVGLSCMSFQYSDALEMAKRVRQHGIPTVMGGYHPTLTYREIADSPDSQYINFIIRGEGEATFRELVRALPEGKFDHIRGLSHHNGTCFIHNPPRPILDVTRLRLPDRNARLINKRFNIFGKAVDVVETSRGCLHGCKFCSINCMYGRTYRTFALPRVIEDISRAVSHGARSVLFVDDNITQEPKRLMALCDAIIEHGLDHIHYHTQASTRGIAQVPGMARKMADAGFKFVFLGIENTIGRNMDFFDKRSRGDEAEIAVDSLRDNHIIVSGGLVLGTPDDTKEDLWSNFRAVKDMKVDIPIFNVTTPYPGTRLRQEMLDLGLVTNPDDFTRYDGLTANIRTRHMDSRQLQLEIWRMASRFYDIEWMKYNTIRRTYPLWFAKRTARIYARYTRRKLLRWGKLRDSDDFFEEDLRNRSYNMSVC
ncbi:MAG: B12-binding domain-containing radical SAM protein [ANME-2 cluster archaeon]|nr:B12-binding domain-containing radical SAM protein [ANME-2 cluster archaeon]